ncbi:MAG: hypothetical protein GC168_06975 [Candidatus Hydrogenedens sp.]|nr:hypothetical protein [Candidatus Hydrogenedens sp.]
MESEYETEALTAEPQEAPSEPPRVLSPVGRQALLGLAAVLAAMAGLLLVGMLEAGWQAANPWGFAQLIPAIENPPEDAEPVRARPVPIENFADQAAQRDEIISLGGDEEAFAMLGLSRTETVYFVGPSFDTLEGALASGRMPVPGEPEVLAGDLARLDRFTMDGSEFTVVGYLKPGTGGTTFAYVLPGHARWESLFEEAAGAVRGYLLRDARPVAEVSQETKLEEKVAETQLPGAEWFSPLQRTHPVFAVAALVLLMIVSLGSAVMHTAGLQWLARHTLLGRSMLIRAMAAYPGLWVGVHLVSFAVFYGAMIYSLLQPLVNFHLMAFVTYVFSDGGLGYLGDAYASGNMIAAANATWWNNYVVQTLNYTLMLSLIPLALGFIKTLGSLALVGLIMSPQWTGTAASYAVHAGTLALEIEPYLIACFPVVLWPWWVFQSIRGREWLPGRLRQTLFLFAETAVLTGILLYGAALYEAVTLILLMGG